MANISTVSIRAFLNQDGHSKRWPNWRPCFDPEMWSVLLEQPTYYVPVFMRQDHECRFIDFQFGARWSHGFEAEELFERFSRDLRSVWVRWTDDGGLLDRIYDHDQERGSDDTRYCRYGFDEIRALMNSADTLQSELPSGASSSGREIRIPGRGAYLGANDRGFLGEGRHMQSPTTPAFENSWWELRDVWPKTTRTMIERLKAVATELTFSWRGRVVHQARRIRTDEDLTSDDDGWSSISLDDWDNCMDLRFLQACNEETWIPEDVYTTDKTALQELVDRWRSQIRPSL